MKTEPTPSAQPVAIHPLLAREIRPIRNWHEWLERWQSAITSEELLGLLHFGFNVQLDTYRGEPTYDHVDRLIFYFGIANGWANPYGVLRTTEDEHTRYHVGYDKNGNREMKSPHEIRAALALKALNTLISEFFTKKGFLEDLDEDEFLSLWENRIFNERLFPVLMDFFRPTIDRFGDLYITNVPLKHLSPRRFTEITPFFLKLTKFLWTWRQEEIVSWTREPKAVSERNAITKTRIEEAQVWMIQILIYLDQLDVIEHWISVLNDACVDKLTEVAMQTTISRSFAPVKKDRLAASLDEAWYAGSSVAAFLLQRKNRLRIHEQLATIRAAEREQEEATRKLRELKAGTPA